MQFTSTITINFHGLNSIVCNLAWRKSGWSCQVPFFKKREGTRYTNYYFLLMVITQNIYTECNQLLELTLFPVICKVLPRQYLYLQLNMKQFVTLYTKWALFSLLSNITLPSVICCYLCHLFPLPYKPRYKKLAIFKSFKIWDRAAKQKLSLESASRVVFLHPQTSARSVQHRRRYSRQLY